MTSAFFSFLLVLVGASVAIASVLLSRAHLKRVQRVTSGQTTALAIALKRLPPSERLSALAKRAPAGSVELRLAEELRAARDEAARVDAIADVLADIDLAFEASASWPSAAARIAVYGALACAALTLLLRSGPYPPAALVVVGIAGAALSVSLGERARGLASEQRRAFDALVDALVLRERTPVASAERNGRARRRDGGSS